MWKRTVLMLTNLTKLRRLKADFAPGELPVMQQVYDNGGLAYPVAALNEWSLCLMNTVRNEVRADNLSNDCIDQGWRNITQNKELGKLFIKGYMDVFGADVFDDDFGCSIGNAIAETLTRKAYHARANVVVKVFKDSFTGRVSNRKGSETLRVVLKFTTGGGDENPKGKRKRSSHTSGSSTQANNRATKNSSRMGANGKRKNKKKDPNKPKGPLSSFKFFSQHERKRVVARDPSLNKGETAKEIGRLWKEATSEDKAKYEKLAKIDKERYSEAMKSYVPSPALSAGDEDAVTSTTSNNGGGGDERSKKKKDPNKPKGPLSSFNFFSQHERERVVARDPSLKRGETAKEIGRL